MNTPKATLRECANTILDKALTAVKPHKLIPNMVRLSGELLTVGKQQFDLHRYENLYVIGAGKASGYMAAALEEILGDKISDGLVIVKYDHSAPCQRITIREAGHPVPDKNGLNAAREMLSIIENAGEQDLVICLISGGGSALMEKPAGSISLRDLQSVSQQLLSCGAAIEEINMVRKHLSEIKGGQLARAIFPATCISLIISDVIGDPLSAIASGPTVPDASSFADAWQIVEKYHLHKSLPSPVIGYLQNGISGTAKEALKPGDNVFLRVHNIIIGNNITGLRSAETAAAEFGYNTLVLSNRVEGEAREIAKEICGIVKKVIGGGKLPDILVGSSNDLQGTYTFKRFTNSANESPAETLFPLCILFGGETTVTIRGKGKGGRNQEFALAAVSELKDLEVPYIFISCGTDGTDGPTDAAGAMVSPEICDAVESAGLPPDEYLNNNDAYHFFEQVDGLIKTGPTGTNVMDIGIVLIGEPDSSVR